MLFLLFLHRRFRKEKRRPHRSGPSFLQESPWAIAAGRASLSPYRFPAGQTPTTVTPSLRPRNEEGPAASSPRAIPRGPPPLVGPVRRGSDPAKEALAGAECFGPAVEEIPVADRRPRFRSASVIFPWMPEAVTSKPNPKP
jgi:hypothetical protein